MDCGYVIYKSGSSDEPACVELTNKIKGSMYKVANEFVYIGFLLAECDYYETYKEWGYSSIHEYASDQLGFKKSSTYNFINVCKAFSANYNTVSVGYSLPFSMIMKDAYSSFNYSQLVEMLSMNEKQRSQVTPDMSVKQIREVKKSSDASDSRRLEDIPEVPSDDAASLQKVHIGCNKANKQMLYDLFDEMEDMYLSFAEHDKSLFECALELFEKYDYHLYRDSFVYK